MGAGAKIHPATETLCGDYVLGEVLGTGGTAIVYRATHRGSGRQAAVKVFSPGVMGADGLPGQRSVAAALAQVHHPGLVEIYESGVDAERMYLVMRLIEGQSLSAWFRKGSLSGDDVMTMGAELADTLAHVHDRGIVHRDIKPSNVLLDVQQNPYLTDFGISRFVDTTRVTATGMTVGTPAFMAPEQVRGERVGPPADIYSLGLVLLEAATGRREYPGGIVESAVARLHRTPAVPENLPEPLREILSAMTSQDPDGRPTAAAVAERLRPPPGAAHETLSMAAPPPPGHRSGVWIAAAAAVVLLAAVVSGLVDLTGYSDPPTAITNLVPPVAHEPSMLLPPTTGALPTDTTAVPGLTASLAPISAPGAATALREPGTVASRDTRTIAHPSEIAPPDRTPDDVQRSDRASGEQSGNGKSNGKNSEKSKGGPKATGRKK